MIIKILTQLWQYALSTNCRQILKTKLVLNFLTEFYLNLARLNHWSVINVEVINTPSTNLRQIIWPGFTSQKRKLKKGKKHRKKFSLFLRNLELSKFGLICRLLSGKEEAIVKWTTLLWASFMPNLRKWGWFYPRYIEVKVQSVSRI